MQYGFRKIIYLPAVCKCNDGSISTGKRLLHILWWLMQAQWLKGFQWTTLIQVQFILRWRGCCRFFQHCVLTQRNSLAVLSLLKTVGCPRQNKSIRWGDRQTLKPMHHAGVQPTPMVKVGVSDAVFPAAAAKGVADRNEVEADLCAGFILQQHRCDMVNRMHRRFSQPFTGECCIMQH